MKQMEQKKRNRALRIGIICLIGLLLLSFFAFDLGGYLSLENLKLQKDAFADTYEKNRVMAIAAYMIIYIAVTGLSLPGAAIMSLAGGALFGLWAGVVMVSFSSTIGATIAFLVSRFIFRDWVQEKFGPSLTTVNEGVKKDGGFYLFTLRLVPVFPFFMINLAMGLTPIRPLVFFLVSQIGMLPGTIVYINAGTHLGKIDSIQGILSPGLILSFVLLGIFPFIAKRFTGWLKARKTMSAYKKPAKFDYNIVVIGAGSAGLVSSIIAATVKSRVALIEKNRMGGDCLNTGCVPSKALIRSAKIISYVNRSREFGFDKGKLDFDFAQVMERVQKIIKKVEPHDSVERYISLGVDCIHGEAKVVSPYEIEVGGKTLTTRNIIVATGASPFVPPVPGLEQVGYFTSDTIWNLRKLPDRFLVLGGGPIGTELCQAFARLGSNVTQLQRGPYILPREDTGISKFIQSKLESDNVTVLTRHAAKKVVVQDGRKTMICEKEGKEVGVEFDEILVAVGRVPGARGFGLGALGVDLTPRGTVHTNEFLQTSMPNIFCAGDVAGPYQFTHFAAHQAWYATVNALFGWIKKFKTDYRVIPWATFTDPEVARVGLNEKEAHEKNIPYEVTRYNLDDLDRAIADSEDHGMVKVLTRPKSDKILGVTIMGSHASDIIAEYVFAMKQNLGLNKILGTIHIYPTLAEANKYAAGEWKKARIPVKTLALIERFHAWRRG